MIHYALSKTHCTKGLYTMAALAQLQGSCAFDTTLSEEIDKIFQPQWSLLTQSSSSAHVCTERIQWLSLQSRLVSATVGGFLVTLIGACDLDVQGTWLFHNVSTNPGHPVTCCCNSKPLLKFEGKGNASDRLLKHRSFQCANRKATGCGLTWWKEHPFISLDEGTIIIRFGVPLRKVPSSLFWDEERAARLGPQKHRSSLHQMSNSWEGMNVLKTSSEGPCGRHFWNWL